MRLKAVTTFYYEIEDSVYETLTGDEVAEAIQNGQTQLISLNMIVTEESGKVIEDYTAEDDVISDINERLKSGE